MVDWEELVVLARFLDGLVTWIDVVIRVGDTEDMTQKQSTLELVEDGEDMVDDLDGNWIGEGEMERLFCRDRQSVDTYWLGEVNVALPIHFVGRIEL